MSRRTKILLIITVALLLTALVGCAPTKGAVIDKMIEPERRYMTCTVKPMICTQHRDDEDYYLGLQDGEDTGWRQVDRDTFDAYDVGDYYGGGTR